MKNVVFCYISSSSLLFNLKTSLILFQNVVCTSLLWSVFCEVMTEVTFWNNPWTTSITLLFSPYGDCTKRNVDFLLKSSIISRWSRLIPNQELIVRNGAHKSNQWHASNDYPGHMLPTILHKKLLRTIDYVVSSFCSLVLEIHYAWVWLFCYVRNSPDFGIASLKCSIVCSFYCQFLYSLGIWIQCHIKIHFVTIHI